MNKIILLSLAATLSLPALALEQWQIDHKMDQSSTTTFPLSPNHDAITKARSSNSHLAITDFFSHYSIGMTNTVDVHFEFEVTALPNTNISHTIIQYAFYDDDGQVVTGLNTNTPFYINFKDLAPGDLVMDELVISGLVRLESEKAKEVRVTNILFVYDTFEMKEVSYTGLPMSPQILTAEEFDGIPPQLLMLRDKIVIDDATLQPVGQFRS
ncbi:hypothetical protein [uncultured Umboniibacter sp.]|uniref:hypothetical protein n=1 Tax=uncultured Umboniibacter sp. TaxID=1798917 RepID=UPI0026122B1F|nr:hypothetical protein [uncultured Umboniibacter sp.]